MNQTSVNTSLAILLLAMLAAGSFLLMVRGGFPDGNLTYTALQNFGHFVLFAGLGWMVLGLVHSLLGRRYWMSIVISAVVLMLLGLVVEMFQAGMATRNASITDFMLDIAGMTVGFLVFSLPRIFRRVGITAVFLVVGVIFAILLLSMKPVIPLVGFDLSRPAVPVVRNFDHIFSDRKIEVAGGAQFQRFSGAKRNTLRMAFATGSYSGIIFHEDAGSWSDYQELSIKIFSSLPNNRQIELRINDGLHNNLYEDRYNGSFSISPGFNELRIPIELIVMMGRAVPTGRELDIDNVTRIQIFTNHIDSPFELDLLSIELI